MLEFRVKDLCRAGAGKKIHIRYNDSFTYCSVDSGDSLEGGELINLPEEADELCRNCLREYKRVIKEVKQ